MTRILITFLLMICIPSVWAQTDIQLGADVRWDAHSLIIGGKRVVPAMGEVHYSRIPAAEWQEEVQKMKEGGISIIACYVFWNHIEEIEGQYDWSGQRNLRTFLEICKEAQLPVVIRIGPFCHGEVYLGGIKVPLLRNGFRMVVFSVVIMVIVLFFSQGIMGNNEINFGGLIKKLSRSERKS